MSIPTRKNNTVILASWFNTLRDAISGSISTSKIVTESYSLLGSDSAVQVTPIGIDPVVITLPAALAGKDKKYYIKVREAGNDTPVLLGTISIQAQSGEFIDGENSFSFIENFQTIELISNGTEWIKL